MPSHITAQNPRSSISMASLATHSPWLCLWWNHIELQRSHTHPRSAVWQQGARSTSPETTAFTLGNYWGTVNWFSDSPKCFLFHFIRIKSKLLFIAYKAAYDRTVWTSGSSYVLFLPRWYHFSILKYPVPCWLRDLVCGSVGSSLLSVGISQWFNILIW